MSKIARLFTSIFRRNSIVSFLKTAKLSNNIVNNYIVDSRHGNKVKNLPNFFAS